MIGNFCCFHRIKKLRCFSPKNVLSEKSGRRRQEDAHRANKKTMIHWHHQALFCIWILFCKILCGEVLAQGRHLLMGNFSLAEIFTDLWISCRFMHIDCERNQLLLLQLTLPRDVSQVLLINWCFNRPNVEIITSERKHKPPPPNSTKQVSIQWNEKKKENFLTRLNW